MLIPWKGTKENSQTACHHYDNFLTGLLIGLGGSHLALFAAEFCLESCYLPYLLRETDQQPGQKSIYVYLSQVAFAQIRQSMAFETASRHFWTNAFPDENGCKSVVDLPNGHCSSNYKTGKKNMLSFPSGFENLEDSWWQLITSLLGICPQASWNTPTTLDFASHIRRLQLGHFPAPIKDLQDERWKNSYQNEWCQQIQIDFIAFQSNHLSTNPRDLFGKLGTPRLHNKSGHFRFFYRSWKKKTCAYNNISYIYMYIYIYSGYWL